MFLPFTAAAWRRTLFWYRNQIEIKSTDYRVRRKVASEIWPGGWDGVSTRPHRVLQNDLWASEPLSRLTPSDVFFFCQAAVGSPSLPPPPRPRCPHSTSTITNRHTNINSHTSPQHRHLNSNTHTHTLTNRRIEQWWTPKLEGENWGRTSRQTKDS